jgi:hypothetical protein
MTAKPQDLNPDRPIIGVAVFAEENLRQNRSREKTRAKQLEVAQIPWPIEWWQFFTNGYNDDCPNQSSSASDATGTHKNEEKVESMIGEEASWQQDWKVLNSRRWSR